MGENQKIVIKKVDYKSFFKVVKFCPNPKKYYALAELTNMYHFYYVDLNKKINVNKHADMLSWTSGYAPRGL